MQELTLDELNFVAGGDTAQALRDFAAAAGIAGGVLAASGAEPLAAGAFIVGGVALIGAAIVG